MKTSLLFTVLLAAAQSSLGQGFLDWGNVFAGGERAPIYGVEFFGPWVTGQSALGIPVGNTVYGAPLLTGTGYTFAVYAGPASAVDSSSLTLLVATTFRTSTNPGPQVLPKGLVFGGTITVPGVLPGKSAKFQIRVWDNANPFGGASPMVLSGPLGGVDPAGNIVMNPSTVGWTSFGLHLIPEPSALALGGLGAVAMLAFARSRARSRFPGC